LIALCPLTCATSRRTWKMQWSSVVQAAKNHFLLSNYTFVTLITLSRQNSSRIPMLEALDHLFFMCVCCLFSPFI
jgi:hypothetical protein